MTYRVSTRPAKPSNGRRGSGDRESAVKRDAGARSADRSRVVSSAPGYHHNSLENRPSMPSSLIPSPARAFVSQVAQVLQPASRTTSYRPRMALGRTRLTCASEPRSTPLSGSRSLTNRESALTNHTPLIAAWRIRTTTQLIENPHRRVALNAERGTPLFASFASSQNPRTTYPPGLTRDLRSAANRARTADCYGPDAPDRVASSETAGDTVRDNGARRCKIVAGEIDEAKGRADG